MDMELRKFLLKLLDDLSDLDRCRLHFVLGNEVPKRLRQLNAIENTIQIFDHLIDTGKIFTSLIDALSACGKIDWSENLKKFTQSSSTVPITHPQSKSNQSLTEAVFGDLSDGEEANSSS